MDVLIHFDLFWFDDMLCFSSLIPAVHYPLKHFKEKTVIFFLFKNYFSVNFCLGVATSLALFCALEFPFLAIFYIWCNLKMVHLKQAEEDVSHYL